jgi:hypothetical protein
MKLWKIALFVTVTLAVASCSTFRLSTYNSQPNYFNDKIVVNKINTMNQLRVQMQQDWSLRNNYLQFAIHQDMNWYYDYYYRNNLSRRGFGSAFDFYWNRHDIWWDWSFNSYNWWGYEWYIPSYYSYSPKFYNWHGDFAFMNGIRSSNIAVVKKRKSAIDRIYNKLKTIIEENPNRSYSNVAINTNRNRNYNEPKFTPRVDPNNGLNTNNNFINNNSRSTPDITTRPSGEVLMKGRK